MITVVTEDLVDVASLGGIQVNHFGIGVVSTSGSGSMGTVEMDDVNSGGGSD